MDFMQASGVVENRDKPRDENNGTDSFVTLACRPVQHTIRQRTESVRLRPGQGADSEREPAKLRYRAWDAWQAASIPAGWGILNSPSILNS